MEMPSPKKYVLMSPGKHLIHHHLNLRTKRQQKPKYLHRLSIDMINHNGSEPELTTTDTDQHKLRFKQF